MAAVFDPIRYAWNVCNSFKAALAVSCLAISACGGSSSAQPGSSPNSDAMGSSKSLAQSSASSSGTSIPPATQIIDGSANIWTVSGGVVYENGALAGYTSAVTLLLYNYNIMYVENSAGGWWSWNGNTWVSSGPPLEAIGTSISTPTQIVDGSANIWTVSGGVVYENGALAGYTSAVTLLIYNNNNIYAENSAGGWWSWNGNTWLSTENPLSVPGSATLHWIAPTQNTNGTPVTNIAGYTIYYGSSPGALTQTIQLDDPTATGFVIGNLNAGTYYFAVAAYTAVGTVGQESSVLSKTIP